MANLIKDMMDKTTGRPVVHEVIFNQKSTSGVGSIIDVSGFKTSIISFSTTGTATMTAKIVGSCGLGVTTSGSDTFVNLGNPTFTSAASPTNMLSNISFIDLQAGSTTPGSTGIALSGADGTYLLKVNTDGIKYLTVALSEISAGTATAFISKFA